MTQENAQEKAQRPISTRQWVEEPVFLALQKTAKTRPDYEVLVTEIEKDGEVILAELSFRHIGRVLFVRRLTSFIIQAMKDNYKEPTTSDPIPVPA